MISRISGTIVATNDKSIVIDVSGVGYLVNITTDAVSRIEHGALTQVELWTHLAVRENSMELFGFFTREELDFFEMLINVSGIGPRGALGIIAIGSVETLKNAIGSGDTAYLTKVSGIGRKTAEKIVLELKDKLSARGHSAQAGTLRSESDALEALVSLGYSQNEARTTLQEIPSEITDTGARVKEALKLLGRK